MPDKNRLDLNADLDSVSNDFLKDIEAATKQAKQRKADDIAKDRRNAAKEKDRKISMIVIGAAVLVLIVIAAWFTFGRGEQGTAIPSAPPPQQNVRLNPPVNNAVPPPKAPPRVAPAQRHNPSADQQPYDDGGQPGQ